MYGDEKYIFDIAVYSVTSDKFFAEREKPFKGPYIDMETFINIGPFVNWRKLIGLD